MGCLLPILTIWIFFVPSYLFRKVKRLVHTGRGVWYIERIKIGKK